MDHRNRRRFTNNESQTNRSEGSEATETNKVRRYVHSPFSIEHNENVKASCDKTGKVTITVSQPGIEEYDEVVVPASLIFRLSEMLIDTRKVRWIPKEEADKLKEE